MNRKKSRTVPVLLAVLLSAALLGGCGSGTNDQVPQMSAGLTGAVAAAGINNCTGCHPAETAGWLASKHANAVNGLSSAGSPTLGGDYSPGACGGCHDPNGDSANIAAAGYIGIARPVVGCEACHGNGSLHNGSGPISLLSNTTGTTWGGTVAASGQFVMCTNCHELLDPTGNLNTSPTHSTGAPDPNGPAYVITDTHFATLITYVSDKPTGTITGYAMDFNSPTVCTDCHNPHGTADVNREWAQSAHADTTSVTTNDPWTAHNWSCDGSLGCGTADNRYCQRCHTTTGFAAYVDAIRTGDTALTGRLYAGTDSGFSTPSNLWKPEMLECWGCHTDNHGSLRNPGAYKATYDYNQPPLSLAQVTYQFPDVSSSNLCIPCHSGRNAGATIHKINTAGTTTTVDFGNVKPRDSHFAPAAAVVFHGAGYEYSGRVYTDPTSYRHAQIGTAAAPNTGSGGPCVGCHMFRSGQPANHLFEAVAKAGDSVLSITSQVCYNCHPGSGSLLAATAEQERLALVDATDGLNFFLTQTTAYHAAFTSSTKNWLSTNDTDTTGNTTGKNNLGAEHNYLELADRDPAAYIHNSAYAKRLLYDSIDWLDDNQMNYSVADSLCGQCPNTCAGSGLDADAWCTRAVPYLMERP